MDRYLSSSAASSSVPESSNEDSTKTCSSRSNPQSSALGKRRADRQEEPSSDKRRKAAGDCRRLWHPEWEVNYLVLYDKKSDTCTCLKCNKKIETVKKYALQRHCESAHPDTKDWSASKCTLFVEHTLVPGKLPLLASYKRGYTLAKQQKPLSLGESVVDWAASSDPESKSLCLCL
jgi:hypothetical protein